MKALKTPSVLESYFEIRLNSVVPDVPLRYDLYLVVDQKPVLFRKRGDSLTLERLKLLTQHGGKHFLVPSDQRSLYLDSLKSLIQNPDSKTDLKSKFIKESAYLHVHDLFTKREISPVVTEAKSLVEEMVSFVSSDVDAVASLMRLSVHDYYTYNHCVDVAVYSIVLAKRVFGEDKRMLLLAGLGGLLHDIGKREIDWGLINKTTALTREEWLEIKKHPTYGRDCLENIPSVPDETKLVVYEHHENFDGTGYPQGLKEESISKLSRVVTIADVFDALTTDRSYHKGIPPTEALSMMFGMQPGKFDPTIFSAFNKNFSKRSDLTLPKDFDPCSPLPLTEAVKKK